MNKNKLFIYKMKFLNKYFKKTQKRNYNQMREKNPLHKKEIEHINNILSGKIVKKDSINDDKTNKENLIMHKDANNKNNNTLINLNNNLHFNFDNLFNIIDIEFNENISYIEKINIPTEKETENILASRKNNISFYYYAINHKDLENYNVEKVKIDKDGNCYFRCLSYFFTSSQNYYLFFRAILFLHCNKKKLNNEYYNQKMDLNGLLIPINDYIPNIKKNSFYSGDLELSESIILFNINILVFQKLKNDNNVINYKFLKFYENPEACHYKKLLILVFKNNNHYEIINYKYNSKIINLNIIIETTKINNYNNINLNNGNNIFNNESYKNLELIKNEIKIELSNMLKNYIKYFKYKKTGKTKNFDEFENLYNLNVEKYKLGFNFPYYKHEYGYAYYLMFIYI